MKFVNIIRALWCEPWMIQPHVHELMCEILHKHMTGEAHLPDGIVAQVGAMTQKEGNNRIRMSGTTAVLELEGVIMKRAGAFERMSGATDLDTFGQDFEEVMEDDGVSGVVIHIDSPGGQTVGTPEAAAMIAAAGKPVVAFTDTVMASAAYYIGAGADAIYASPSAVTGSIGVYSALLDSSRKFEMEGLKTEVFQSGKFKAMGLPGTQMDEEMREFMQGRVDDLFDEFAGFVSEHRTVQRESMDGRWWYGQEAMGRGLVDALGGLDDAVNEAREMAGT